MTVYHGSTVVEQPNNLICIINQEVADRYLHYLSSEEI